MAYSPSLRSPWSPLAGTACSRVMGGDLGLYQAAGGIIMTHPENVPANGERFQWEDYRFEVVDMDGPRLEKLLITMIDENKKENSI